MIKKLRLVVVFLVSCNVLYSQISIGSSQLDISIKEELLINDTSSVHLLQIPILSFDVDIYSNPGVSTFFEKCCVRRKEGGNRLEDTSHPAKPQTPKPS